VSRALIILETADFAVRARVHCWRCCTDNCARGS